jgi:hypothetical protein
MSSTSSTKNICNYIHAILREIISEEEYDLCISLFLDDYSEKDIAEFVKRKFLKYINNNFEIIAYQNNEFNTINEESKTIDEESETIDEESITIDEEDINNTITENPITKEESTPINTNDKNKSVKNKPVKNKSIKNKTPKKSTSKSEDFDMNIYISKFKEGKDYINDKKIEIFNKTFRTDFLSTKVSRIIKDLFTTSSAHINGRKTKTFQIIPLPKVKTPKKKTIKKDITITKEDITIPITQENITIPITQEDITIPITQEDITIPITQEDITITQDPIA